MRVAYVCADPGIPVYGTKGCSLHVQEILRALVGRDAHVELFAVRIGGHAPPGCEAVRVHQITVANTKASEERERALIDAGHVLWEMLDGHGPFDLVYERHSLWTSAAMQWAESRGIASVLEVNAPLIEEQARHRTLIDIQTARKLASSGMAAAQVVACVSQSITKYTLSLGADPSRLIVTPNGVRPGLFSQREARSSPSSPLTIGFVGSLRPWHAVGDLVQAFARMNRNQTLPACRLVIVGDGPQRQQLELQIATMPNTIRQRIELARAVAPEEVPGWLSQFDVAVAPYAADGECYFSPLKLFEYMAAGLPTVVADTGQMCEIITRGVTGLVYQPGDVRDLAAQLDWLCMHPQAAEEMGAAARMAAIEQHTWDQRLDHMLEAAGCIPTSDVAG